MAEGFDLAVIEELTEQRDSARARVAQLETENKRLVQRCDGLTCDLASALQVIEFWLDALMALQPSDEYQAELQSSRAFVARMRPKRREASDGT